MSDIHLLIFFADLEEKSMLESKFQASLIKELKKIFPGCLVIKSDPDFRQGIPDLFVFFNDKWAALECKRSETSKHQPNQDYYVDICNKMSFASFVCPENKKEVLDALERSFKS